MSGVRWNEKKRKRMDEDQGIIAPVDEKGNDHKLPWECVGTCMYIGYLTYLISRPPFALFLFSGSEVG